MIVKIQNGNNYIAIEIGDLEGEMFKDKIISCIQNPKSNPLIKYHGKSDFIIFSAEYLKSSLITFSN